MSSSQPRRSPRIAAKMASTQPVQTVCSAPSVSTQSVQQPNPRRSARLSEKLRKQVQDSTYAYVKPLFNQIDSTRDENERSRIVVQIYKYLIANPMALVLYPKFRETVVAKVRFLRSQILHSSSITLDTKISATHCFRKFEMVLQNIRSHPYYVA